MERALGRYLRHHASAGHSAKTIAYHESSIRLFIQWAKDRGYSVKLDDLDVDMVREWVDVMRTAGLSPATLNARVRSLKAFTAWLVAEDWIDRNPLQKLKVPKVGDIEKETLTPQEIDRLLSTCNRRTEIGRRDHAIMLLLFSTGLRANELISLRIEDVDWRQGLAIIRRGKGGKSRVIPLGTKVEKALYRYIGDRDRGPVFLNDEGQPLVYPAMRQMLRRRGDLVQIKCNPHKWRHSAAIQYLRSGGRIETLQKMLGHSTMLQTIHYARIAGVDLTAAHATADPTNALKTR